MKDSGIEWLGEIPEHWEVKRFRYYFDLISEKLKLMRIYLRQVLRMLKVKLVSLQKVIPISQEQEFGSKKMIFCLVNYVHIQRKFGCQILKHKQQVIFMYFDLKMKCLLNLQNTESQINLSQKLQIVQPMELKCQE